jgi:hypothetical protein
MTTDEAESLMGRQSARGRILDGSPEAKCFVLRVAHTWPLFAMCAMFKGRIIAKWAMYAPPIPEASGREGVKK